MNQINRPPEMDAAKPVSFQGGNVPQEIFKHGFVPFCVISTLTVVILAFDLISDWLAWRSLNDLPLADLVSQHEAHFLGLGSIYAHLPIIYLSFCIVASAFALIELCRVLRLLVLQKRKLKESLDGVPYKRNFFDKHSGEILLPLLVLAEDLPLSLLILALQLVTQCPLILPLPNHMILTSVCTSCVSLIWKVGQVIWRSGCCNQRSEFSCSWSVSFLRVFSLLATLSALTLTLLNILLLTRPAFLPSNDGRLMSSVSYARWMQQDHLFLVVRDSEAITDAVKVTPLEHAVIPLEHCFIHPCDNITLPFTAHPGDALNASSSTQCQVLLQTSFSTVGQTLYYDFSYRFFNTDSCHPGRFLPQITTSNESVSRNVSLALALSPKVKSDWMKCDLKMVQNVSMFNIDPCEWERLVTTDS